MGNKKLLEIVQPHVDTPASRAFDLAMMGFIVLGIVSFSLETIETLSDEAKTALKVIELILMIVFSIEYVLRIIAAEKPLKFVFSFFGIVDLLAILPLYLGLLSSFGGFDLRSLRILRLFRIFRALKLLRYSRAIGFFGTALKEVREELILYLIATAFLMYLASTGIYFFEKDAHEDNFQSIFDAMWWSVVTLTTVGYGDVVPVTLGGRIFTGFLLLIGLGVVAVPSGLIASGLTQVKMKASQLENSKESEE